MITLKSYQEDAIKAIKLGFSNGFRQYIEMPTGSGKTITFLSFARESHKKVLVIVPSIQLMNQVYSSSLKFYEPRDISRKGGRFDEYACLDESAPSIHICVINSIKSSYLHYLSTINFDLIIIDEAHHTQANSYKRFINTQGDVQILGVTATPDRVDGLLLKNILNHCSFKLEIQEMIDKKYLCDIEGLSVKTNIDLSDVDDHNGDFSISKLYKKLSTESRDNMILDLCKKDMVNRKTLIFCINIEHSKKVNKLLNENGLSSKHIDGTMEETQRSSILGSFREGETQFLCNCQLLTEGFDEPSIDGIVLARPTRSKSLFTQMIGRGLRLFTGKINCKIIDIVDNHKNLAGFNCLISDDRFSELSSFKGLKDIEKHINDERLRIKDFTTERVDFFSSRPIDKIQALQNQIEYLENNKIQHFQPISFDEASFLIWMDKFKKENHVSR